MEVEPFHAELIIVKERARSKLNEKKITKLMDSIEKIGLTELPCVRYIKDEDGGDRAVLVVGWHRLEALKRLGHEWVECRIFEGSETAARLWEVSENLHRADLTPDDRDKHIREWFNLTGQDHKEEGAQENEPEDGQRDKVTAGGHLARRPGAGPGSVGGVREFARDFNLPLTTVQEA